ncbi:hypothetical protein GF402_03430 [Candidatus Fermentibacteria bacterium]|nr:hypothetical protein [Candidatus Fermentibacteria bacterium]
MLRFPSRFGGPRDISRALYHLSVWGGGRESSVWIPQFASLSNHVREISRTPSGSRVAGMSRQLSLWPDRAELAASLPPPDAADLFAACMREATALLELGYPRGEGLDFVTRAPLPGSNSRRTKAQIRSALHHLGGDFGVFKSLLRAPDRFDPRLKVVFSVWPSESIDSDFEAVHLAYEGQTVPAVVSFHKDVRGYCLLVMFDLAERLRAAEGVAMATRSFAEFVSPDRTSAD